MPWKRFGLLILMALCIGYVLSRDSTADAQVVDVLPAKRPPCPEPTHHIFYTERSSLMKPIFVVLALLLAGCQGFLPAPVNPPPPPTCEELAQQEEGPENLSFETIARNPIPTQLWPETEAGLFVITEPQDLGQITPHVNDEAFANLSNEEAIANLSTVDFGTSLVVGAFSSMSNGGWQFCITNITQQENEINIHVHFVDSPVVPAVTASYYHLIRLPRAALPTGDVTFVLALTRHDYVNPTGRQRVLQTSEEEIVTSVIRTIR